MGGDTIIEAKVLDLGRRGFAEAFKIQKRVHSFLKDSPGHPEVLIAVEHDDVITLGRGCSRADLREHVIAGEEKLTKLGVEVVETNRGGDVTWHGPGQSVVHPVAALKRLGVSLTGYLRLLESSAIDALKAFGVAARTRAGLTGIWVGDEKLGFIGTGCRRWVSYHGLSINVDCDLSVFERIVPCGAHVRPLPAPATCPPRRHKDHNMGALHAPSAGVSF